MESVPRDSRLTESPITLNLEQGFRALKPGNWSFGPFEINQFVRQCVRDSDPRFDRYRVGISIEFSTYFVREHASRWTGALRKAIEDGYDVTPIHYVRISDPDSEVELEMTWDNIALDSDHYDRERRISMIGLETGPTAKAVTTLWQAREIFTAIERQFNGGRPEDPLDYSMVRDLKEGWLHEHPEADFITHDVLQEQLCLKAGRCVQTRQYKNLMKQLLDRHGVSWSKFRRR